MNWTAKWIWNSGIESPRNEWWCFRKSFEIPAEEWERATITLTADSRYVLYINGIQVGRGPVRSWPFEQSFDCYEIGHLLKPGKVNTIAVLVLHYGVSTFYYIRGRGGLLVQIDFFKDQKVFDTTGTDYTWKTFRHLGQDPRSPRMACQQAFSERIDACLWSEDWISTEYDDSSWNYARVIGNVGMKPWVNLKPRDIPPLTEEVIYPSRVDSLYKVKPVKWTTVIDLRNHLIPESADHANPVGYIGFIATIIRVPERVKAVFAFILATVNFGTCWINGEKYEDENFTGTLPERYLEVELLPGDNLFVMDISGQDHGRGFHIGIDCEIEFEFISPIKAGIHDSAFITIGPFDSTIFIDHQPNREMSLTNEIYLEAGPQVTKGDFSKLMNWVRPISNQFVSRDDIFTLSIWKREALSQPVPDSLQNVVIPNAIPALIPCYEGSDVEFIIDFGKELSGYLTFDVDAYEGTIIDFYGFEFMRDGWRQDTYTLDNTLRYICREGRQQYTSPVRRGLRYLMVTVRKTNKILKMYNVHIIQSNYPIAEIGKFQSSDALLNDIWKISQHTTRLCMEDTFVDCPAYEQTFWVGDSRNEALISYYVFGVEEIIKRCLRLVPGSSYQTPLYVDQVPSGWSSVIPNWTFFWSIACNEYYHRTGDINFVKEMWPHIRFTLKHYLEKLDERGLLFMKGANFLDWAPIDQPSDGVVTHQNVFLVKALRVSAELAELIEDKEGSTAYKEAAKRLQKAINLYLWSNERQAYIDCIHADGCMSTIYSMQTQVAAYLCGIPEGERKNQIEGYLRDHPEGFIKIGSPFMSFFYYEALAQAGQLQWMLDDIRRNYGQMIEYDATTCWETYPKILENSIISDAPTRSHCHAWSAAPGYFLGAYILGVRSISPGWDKILVEPQPCGLTWARGSIPLPGQGRIDVAWRVDEGEKKMNLRIWVPRGIKVDINVPEGYKENVQLIEY